jgi:membrane-associated phospholipid phosphatase
LKCADRGEVGADDKQAGCSLTLFVTLWCALPVAQAQSLVYTLEKKKELVWIVAGGALLGVSALVHPTQSCPCDSATVNGFDRRFAGRPVRPGVSTASDILNYGSLSLPFVLEYMDTHRNKAATNEFWNDAVVLGEALLLNEGLTDVTKALAGRPRPFVYNLPAGSPELQLRDSYQSFYSGHTSSTFAITMAYAQTYARRHPNGRRRLVYGIAIGLGSTIGALRVAAHEHFPTDVIASAGSGIAVGLLVPALHR